MLITQTLLPLLTLSISYSSNSLYSFNLTNYCEFSDCSGGITIVSSAQPAILTCRKLEIFFLVIVAWTALSSKAITLLQYLNKFPFLSFSWYLNLQCNFHSALFHYWYSYILSTNRKHCYSSLLLSIYFMRGNLSYLFCTGKYFWIAFLQSIYTELYYILL